MGNARWVRSCTGALAAGAARGSGLLVGSFPLFVGGGENGRSFFSILPSGKMGSFPTSAWDCGCGRSWQRGTRLAWVRSCISPAGSRSVGSFPLFAGGVEHGRSFFSILLLGIVGSFLRGMGEATLGMGLATVGVVGAAAAAKRAAWRRSRSRKVAWSRLSQAASWRKRRAARGEVSV